MGYCAVSDVAAEFKKITFDSLSNVTDTAVQGFIDESSAMIDSIVGAKYVVPVTGTQSLLVMSLYCRVLVADRVAGILANKQTTNADANQNIRMPGMTTKDVLLALNALKNGDTVLPDQLYQLDSNAAFFSNNYQNNVNPRFRKERRQW